MGLKNPCHARAERVPAAPRTTAEKAVASRRSAPSALSGFGAGGVLSVLASHSKKKAQKELAPPRHTPGPALDCDVKDTLHRTSWIDAHTEREEHFDVDRMQDHLLASGRAGPRGVHAHDGPGRDRAGTDRRHGDRVEQWRDA